MNTPHPAPLKSTGISPINKKLFSLPLLIALVFLLLGGWFLLTRADAQARDTIRKHHLEDLEHALYFARSINGTYPPYEQPFWCGIISSPANAAVHAQIEEVLRTQNEKYANPDKPFPTDPLADQSSQPDYFYWKRGPANFELYSILETDLNHERSTIDCQNATSGNSPSAQPDQPPSYDYGLNSIWRENQ